ncbi:MAG: 16S rRNA (cytosine(1402)-N(4))-methyltransferase RsmH [Bacteroidales bacterium]|nr:16S rRNA (cytosine(1402)-N(4))-methyltransferase RsmH [Bacteroidales bacterium]
MNGYHCPVMLNESMEALSVNPGGTYVDVTFGSGQSSKAILDRLGESGRLFAFDQDPDARQNIPDDPRFTFIASNFKYIRNYLQYHGVECVDGILADLGVSSHQFDVAGRGFSTRLDGPLDMRMDPGKGITAADLLASCTEAGLADIFRRYGELPNARRLANMIVSRRRERPILRTAELVELAEACSPQPQRNRYLAQLFQALRMEVNGEMEALSALLVQSVGLLRTGGRLVVISYHSLEDRMVKQFMRSGNLEGKEEKDFYGRSLSPMRPVIRKAVTPSETELAENSRSRSARLRVGEKVDIKEITAHGKPN